MQYQPGWTMTVGYGTSIISSTGIHTTCCSIQIGGKRTKGKSRGSRGDYAGNMDRVLGSAYGIIKSTTSYTNTPFGDRDPPNQLYKLSLVRSQFDRIYEPSNLSLYSLRCWIHPLTALWNDIHSTLARMRYVLTRPTPQQLHVTYLPPLAMHVDSWASNSIVSIFSILTVVYWAVTVNS